MLMLRNWKLELLACAALAGLALTPAEQATAQSGEPIKIGCSVVRSS